MRASRVVIVAALLVIGGASPAHADGAKGATIVPINGNALGRIYSGLAADWWKWALQTPTPTNALIDTTGANCGKNQINHLWFLAGTAFGGTIARTCTIPKETFLFFPMANDFYAAFLTDPDNTRTEAYVRSQTTCILGAALTADIDGVPVKNPAQYLEQSPLFIVHLPTNNIFGLTSTDVPGLTFDPTVDRGYYLLVEPLAPGKHTIHFGSAPGASTCAPTQDITYHVTVK